MDRSTSSLTLGIGARFFLAGGGAAPSAPLAPSPSARAPAASSSATRESWHALQVSRRPDSASLLYQPLPPAGISELHSRHLFA